MIKYHHIPKQLFFVEMASYEGNNDYIRLCIEQKKVSQKFYFAIIDQSIKIYKYITCAITNKGYDSKPPLSNDSLKVDLIRLNMSKILLRI